MVIVLQKNLFFITAVVVLLLDQLSKSITRGYLDFTKNYGAAFGILQGYKWLFIFVGVFVAVVIFYYRDGEPFALGLLMGGTIGNLIDRIFFGYVVDFIDVGWWPSFNVADAANTVGAILIVLLILGYGVDWKKMVFIKR